MMRWSWLGFAAACASPERPAFEAPVMTVSSPDGPALVEASSLTGGDPGYKMRFATDGLPTELTLVDGVNLLGAASCPAESLVGTTIFPAAHAAGDLNGEGTGSLTTELAGPAIARIRVSYEVPYQCDGAQRLHGTSVFTFFPLGRIVRSDEVIASDTAVVTGPNCGCSDNAAFFFTSFWAFAGFGDVTGVANTQYANFPATAFSVGLVWHDLSRPPRENAAGGINTALTFDFIAPTGSIAGGVEGTVQSSVQLGAMAADPASLFDRLAPRDIAIGGNAAMLVNGVYVAQDLAVGGVVRVESANGILAGTAIGLAGDPDHVRVTLPDGKDGRVLLQRDPLNDLVLIWFEDAFAAGQTITIERLDG